MTAIAAARLSADDFTPAAAALVFEPGVHTYRVGMTDLPSVTGILRACGVSVDFERLVENGYLTAFQLEEKRSIGQAVHLAAHFYDDGQLDTASVDPRVEGYLQSWIDWRAQTGFVPALLETPLHHPGLFFAGTLDRAGTFTKFEGTDPRDLQVVDIKCGNPEDAAAQWQTAAYAELLAVSLRADVLFDRGGPSAFRLRPRYSVQLHPDGRARLNVYADYLRDWTDFQHFVTTFRRQACRRKKP